jgi:hypothetical protein
MAVAVLALAVLAGITLARLVEARPRRAVLATSLIAPLVLGLGYGWKTPFLLPLLAAALCLPAIWRRRGLLVLGAVALLAVTTVDLAWHGAHQDRDLKWRSAASIFPTPAPSARFLLARQASGSSFRFATAADADVLHHQLGAAGTPGARALLLDSESVRLGLEDVAGYNPVHLKAYNRYLLASNGGVAVDRHLEYVLRAPTPRLRALGVRYYVSPPGQQPKGLPVVYRDRLSVITRDPQALPLARVVRPGRAPQAARIVRRESDRVEIETAGAAGTLVLADAAYPGWRVSVDGHAAHVETVDDLFRGVQVGAGAHRVVWTFHAVSLRRGLWISVAALLALAAAAAAWPAWLRRRSG